jgi:uncharacterized protein
MTIVMLSANEFRLDTLAPNTRQHLGIPVESKVGIDAPLLRVEVLVGRAARPCLGLVAGVHGDEYDGILAAQEILRVFQPERLAGSLLIIPVANPYAFRAGQRHTPEDGLDLNRVFPGRAEGTLTERLAEVLCQRLLRQTDAVFSLHGASTSGVLSPWVEFWNQPNATGRASYALACASGFRDLIALPRLQGVLLNALAEQGIPLIEGEVGGRGVTQSENVAYYVQRICAVAHHVGVLADAVPPAGDGPSVWHLNSIEAPSDGLFMRRVALRQQVRKDELLGALLDPLAGRTVDVHAPRDGVIGGYREHLAVRSGQPLLTLWTPALEVNAVGEP